MNTKLLYLLGFLVACVVIAPTFGVALQQAKQSKYRVSEIPNQQLLISSNPRGQDRDWAINFESDAVGGLPSVTIISNIAASEGKPVRKVYMTRDIEIDGKVDLVIEYESGGTDAVVSHAGRLRVAGEPDTWADFKSFLAKDAAATGLDGTVYVYTPGKGFEPKAK